MSNTPDSVFARLHLDTQVLHRGFEPEAGTGASVPPIFQTSAFAYEDPKQLEDVFAGRDIGHIYTRISNPTIYALERRLAMLENGLGAVACSSGMAAVSTAILCLAGQGDEIVSGSSVFGGTYSLFAHTLCNYGIRTRFVNATDPAAYAEAINDRTKVVFVETIGNPKLDVPDLAAIAATARREGVVLMVDSTVTTPVMLRPKDLGADIVIHSASKYINGHGNSIGGMIVDCGTFDWSSTRYPHVKPYHARVRNFAFIAALRNRVHRDLGCCLSPFNAFLIGTGLESLAVRMERHCTNAARVAAFLASEPQVLEVRYPGLPTHPDHTVAARQFAGRFGGLLTFRLGSRERCFAFIRGLKVALNLANLGDAKTLVIHPASTICRDASPAEREAMGVTEDLVRFSVGLEYVDDIIADVAGGLRHMQEKESGT